MDLIITMLNGRSVTLTVSPQDKVGRLKQLIQQALAVPAERQRLIFVNGSGQRVELSDDSRSLVSYGLLAGSMLSLLVIEPFQVFLRNEKGVLSTYDISPNETVSEFKRSVKCREGVEESQQRLVFQGQEMTQGKLSDYGVVAHSTIDLLLRLRGGQ